MSLGRVHRPNDGHGLRQRMQFSIRQAREALLLLQEGYPSTDKRRQRRDTVIAQGIRRKHEARREPGLVWYERQVCCPDVCSICLPEIHVK